MSDEVNQLPFTPLTLGGKVTWAFLAVASFHLAYQFEICAPLIVVFLLSIFQLARVATRPQATAIGIGLGMAIYAPQLSFFWTIFGPAAIALWFVLAFWLALYLMLQRFALLRCGSFWGALCAPFLWTGLEYFRSELYYLRFSWLNIGYVFASSPDFALLGWLGMYGVGFVLMFIATVMARWRIAGWAVTVSLVVIYALLLPTIRKEFPLPRLAIAGVQLEFPDEKDVPKALDDVVARHPDAELIVLSEYTFDGPVPKAVKDWCAKSRRHLIAGGKDFLNAAQTDYFNTAFVIGPDGGELFKQVKSVPIQFFTDGRPAVEQKLWNSPWGKLGICICYDLSYTQVTDELIRQGAQAIIVPTMDIQEWGERQHRLHARVAPVRAAEYGVPILRLCSSGMSQVIDRYGNVVATASFPGQGESLGAALELPRRGGRLPWDRVAVWPCVFVTAFALVWHLVDAWNRRRWPRSVPVTQTTDSK